MQILKARFRSPATFLEMYNKEAPWGGLFCPTTNPLEENAPVLVEVRFPGLPNKIILRGRVLWWRSAVPRLRVRAGAMVEFSELDHDKRDFLLEVASGQRAEAIKRRHTRIPIEIIVRWRPVNSSTYRESELQDISVGGAQLMTDEPLEIGEDIVLELTTPGAAQSISIAGKITFHGKNYKGVRFMYRDAGGTQRLREVVRRLIAKSK